MTNTQPNEADLGNDDESLLTQSAEIELRPDGLPEKFWDQDANQIRLDALIQSYLELEKKLSQPRKSELPDPNNPENRTMILRALGVPETADEYQVNVPHDLFDADTALHTRFHEKGFTPEQVQMVYDLAAEKLMPIISELANDYEADREIERLIAAFGGVSQWQEVSRQLLAFGRQNLPEKVLNDLSNSFEGVMMLYKMMQNEQDGKLTSPEKLNQTLGLNKDDLHNMMRDPAYWRDKNPKLVNQVTQGFKDIYGQ